MKYALTFVLIISMFLVVGCSSSKTTEDGMTPLPSDQADKIIASVKSFKLENGLTFEQTLNNAITRFTAKNVKAVVNGWRAYTGPDSCTECYLVHLVVTVQGESEKYEFLVKDGGKSVTGLNDGTKMLLHPIVEKQAKSADKPTQDKPEAATEKLKSIKRAAAPKAIKLEKPTVVKSKKAPVAVKSSEKAGE